MLCNYIRALHYSTGHWKRNGFVSKSFRISNTSFFFFFYFIWFKKRPYEYRHYPSASYQRPEIQMSPSPQQSETDADCDDNELQSKRNLRSPLMLESDEQLDEEERQSFPSMNYGKGATTSEELLSQHTQLNCWFQSIPLGHFTFLFTCCLLFSSFKTLIT